jgi:hypothetical protein
MNLTQTTWFQRLEEHEQRDVGQVVQTLHDWANVKLAKPSQFGSTHNIEYAQTYALENFYFFSLYAIGSVVTDKPNPTDTDLLLVTNLFPNEVYGVEPKLKDLVAKLEGTHQVVVDGEVSDRYSDVGTEARLKLDLQRKDEGYKPIDVIYQWDILSPAHWEAHDKFKTERIFNVGADNPQGYNGRLRRGTIKIPLDLLRNSQAQRKGYE